MVTFINSFLSYLILVLVSFVLIVLGVVCGKKLRDSKDAKTILDEDKSDVENM